MKPAPFGYARPDSVAETLQLLARHGEDARVLAGGQSLAAMLNMRLVTPAILIDVNRLDELTRIEPRDGTVVTGALVRQADALRHPVLGARVPLLAAALPHVGHYQTRSRGTLGGSVAHADPSAEIPLVLATLGGEIELRSRRRTRRVAAGDFFRSALTTARAPDELVVALHWPAPSNMRHGFAELALRGGDYAIVAVACAIELDDDGRVKRLRLGFGGCGEAPQVIERADFSSERADEIAREAAAQMACRSDLHATDDYRRHLAGVLAREVLQKATS